MATSNTSIKTEIKRFLTRNEAIAASKEARKIGAQLCATGLHESDYPSKRSGACSFDNDWFYVVYPKVGA